MKIKAGVTLKEVEGNEQYDDQTITDPSVFTDEFVQKLGFDSVADFFEIYRDKAMEEWDDCGGTKGYHWHEEPESTWESEFEDNLSPEAKQNFPEGDDYLSVETTFEFTLRDDYDPGDYWTPPSGGTYIDSVYAIDKFTFGYTLVDSEKQYLFYDLDLTKMAQEWLKSKQKPKKNNLHETSMVSILTRKKK